MQFTFKVGSKIKEAWPIYKENLGTLLLMSVVTFIVSMISSDSNFIIEILSFVVSALVFYVWTRFIFALLEKKKFNPFSKVALPSLLQYWNLIKTVIVYSLCILGGMILLIVPGLYFIGRLAFAPYLSVEKNQGARKSIKESWEATRGNGWKIFWKSLLIGLFMLVGFLALFLGIFITYPLGLILMIMLYREFFKPIAQPSVNVGDSPKTGTTESNEPKVEVVKDLPNDTVKEEVKEI